MKNEPVLTYNHMQDDQATQFHYSHSEKEPQPLPLSLYLILATDIVLMAALAFLIYKIML